MRFHNYFVYILTNAGKNVLYTGMTNSLERRVYEHENRLFQGFTKRYNCHFLVYYEHFNFVWDAINREKQIKRWRREKKLNLINAFNPEWRFLNDELLEGYKY